MRRAEGGLALSALVIVTAGSLPEDSHAFGQIGLWISTALRSSVGMAAWLVPLWIADIAVRTFVGRFPSPQRAVRWVLFTTLSALTLTLLVDQPGGWVGQQFASMLTVAIGLGAHLLVLGTWLVILMRMIGPERVNSIGHHAATISHQALTQQRARISSIARPVFSPVFAPVIDEDGSPVLPPPLPVPAPPVAAPFAAPQPPAATPAPRALPRKPSKWDLPDVELLQEPTASNVDSSYREAVARNLADRLRHFRLAATVEAAQQQGAVVSRYEITPAATQEIKPITARLADLEAAYKGLRFVSLPGTGKLGVEIPVPDSQRGPIALRTVLDTQAWTESEAKLPLALGVTSAGDPVVIDLASCPHLLVAGATGAGKSVGINGMLVSLLLRHSPSELQLLLIDPKVVELARFRGLPHLICPPITEQADAVDRLLWACDEMDRRYKQFVAADASDLDSYNECVATADRLPRIVIVIDEYADLSSVAKDQVEGPVIRIAQKARAAGIHMILATQRPSVEIVTGAIKANFPSRIAYKVAQREDSKTIIGANGAEKLLGNGDSLVLIPALSTDLTRVHGAFISKDEVKAVCRSWTSQTTAERAPEPRKVEKPAQAEPEEQEEEPAPRRLPAPQPPAADDLFPRAVAVARTKGHVSARLLVEELNCGFSKAKKLFARMHEQNLIKPGGPNNTHVYCGADAQ